MYMFGAINVVLAAFVWFLIPETKGLELENMDTIFGGESHAERGADMVEEKDTARRVIEYAGQEAARNSKDKN